MPRFYTRPLCPFEQLDFVDHSFGQRSEQIDSMLPIFHFEKSRWHVVLISICLDRPPPTPIARYSTLQTHASVDHHPSTHPLMSDQEAPAPHLQTLHQRNGRGQNISITRLLHGPTRDG